MAGEEFRPFGRESLNSVEWPPITQLHSELRSLRSAVVREAGLDSEIDPLTNEVMAAVMHTALATDQTRDLGIADRYADAFTMRLEHNKTYNLRGYEIALSALCGISANSGHAEFREYAHKIIQTTRGADNLGIVLDLQVQLASLGDETVVGDIMQRLEYMQLHDAQRIMYYDKLSMPGEVGRTAMKHSIQATSLSEHRLHAAELILSTDSVKKHPYLASLLHTILGEVSWDELAAHDDNNDVMSINGQYMYVRHLLEYGRLTGDRPTIDRALYFLNELPESDSGELYYKMKVFAAAADFDEQAPERIRQLGLKQNRINGEYSDNAYMCELDAYAMLGDNDQILRMIENIIPPQKRNEAYVSLLKVGAGVGIFKSWQHYIEGHPATPALLIEAANTLIDQSRYGEAYAVQRRLRRPITRISTLSRIACGIQVELS